LISQPRKGGRVV